MSFPKRGSASPYGAWRMKRRAASQLLASPRATKAARTRAPPATRERQGIHQDRRAKNAANVGLPVDPQGETTGERRLCRSASRYATNPFSHKTMKDAAITARKRATFARRTVQKTSG